MPLSRLILILWLCFAAAAQARAPEPTGDRHAVVAGAADDAGKWTVDEPDGGTVPRLPTVPEPRFERAAPPSAQAVALSAVLRPVSLRARAPPRR